MAKIGRIDLKGKEHPRYMFNVYPAGMELNTIWAVYIISNRDPETKKFSHVYLGQTNNIQKTLEKHKKDNTFAKNEHNCVGVLHEENKEKRLESEKDLLEVNKFPCN